MDCEVTSDEALNYREYYTHCRGIPFFVERVACDFDSATAAIALSSDSMLMGFVKCAVKPDAWLWATSCPVP